MQKGGPEGVLLCMFTDCREGQHTPPCPSHAQVRFLSAEEEQGSVEPHLELLVRHMDCCQLPSGGLGVRFERSHLPALLASLLDNGPLS